MSLMKGPDVREKGEGIENGAKVLLSINCLPREPLANLICHMSASRRTHALGVWSHHHFHADISVDTVHEDVAAICERHAIFEQA